VETWRANPDAELVAGETYRIRSTVRGPYNGTVVGLMRAHARFESWAKDLEFVSFDSSPPMMSAHAGTLAPWTAVFTFRPRPKSPAHAGLDPRAMVGLAAVIVAAALSLYLVEAKLEKLVRVVGDELLDPPVDLLKDLLEKLLSPGTVLLGFVAFGLFMFYRRKKK